MLEKCVLNSYLILLFSRKIPTFSYFLMKIPTFSYFFELSYYLTPCPCVPLPVPISHLIKSHSHRANAESKAKIFLDVNRLFFDDLFFRLSFDIFAFTALSLGVHRPQVGNKIFIYPDPLCKTKGRVGKSVTHPPKRSC